MKLTSLVTSLFHDTVRRNLAWANPSATESDMWAALETAEAGGVVRRMDHGLDSIVGEISEHGLDIRLLVHPVFTVERSETGKLNAFHGAHKGNGRRESFAHVPMPRMTNTYMLAGEHDPAEILASVKNGIYAVNFGGGQVDITSGKYVFECTEAYRIEHGKIKYVHTITACKTSNCGLKLTPEIQARLGN